MRPPTGWRRSNASGRSESGPSGSCDPGRGRRAPDRSPAPPDCSEWDRNLAYPAIWLREPYWGRGYSGERADALLELAFDRLELSVVAIPIHRENERSYRAVQKYVERHGGRYEGLLRNDAMRSSGPIDRHRFSITREEYERNRGNADVGPASTD